MPIDSPIDLAALLILIAPITGLFSTLYVGRLIRSPMNEPPSSTLSILFRVCLTAEVAMLLFVPAVAYHLLDIQQIPSDYTRILILIAVILSVFIPHGVALTIWWRRRQS